MLQPSGGFFKKMFSPDNMKKKATAPMTRTPMTGAIKSNKMASGKGPLGKAVARKVV
jgi:hypothetical protein